MPPRNTYSRKQEMLDTRARELELKLKEAELKEKLQATKRKWTLNQSLLIAVIGGAAGILGSVLNTWIQHANEQQLERQRFDSSLILKAIETDDPAKSVTNLNFLLELNLISDERSELKKMLADSAAREQIPATLDTRSIVQVIDTMGIVQNDVEVLLNHIFVGKTDNRGCVRVGLSLKNVDGIDVEARKNGVEMKYDRIATDLSNKITLIVLP
ncbi:MAG: hypothetical protein J7578_24115 [Chitinophagaceae bacterium]|nr:hypothetical protein [Chitinophagaceae bacterium]